MPRRGSLAFVLAAIAGLCACGSSGEVAKPKPRDARAAQPVHAAPYRRPVPILMYHETRAFKGLGFAQLYVTRSHFLDEMRWLRRHGYEAVTLSRLEDAWRGRARLPRRPVVLTFDDGYRSNYTNAFPILRRFHWPGVMNLAVANMKVNVGVNRAMVRRMIRAGWELASHTISHLDLKDLPPAQLRKEVAGSRRLLRRWFRVPVENFCYPAGRYNARVVAAVRRAGYRGATTVTPGLARPRHPFLLKRVRVDAADDVAGLATKLRALRR